MNPEQYEHLVAEVVANRWYAQAAFYMMCVWLVLKAYLVWDNHLTKRASREWMSAALGVLVSIRGGVTAMTELLQAMYTYTHINKSRTEEAAKATTAAAATLEQINDKTVIMGEAAEKLTVAAAAMSAGDTGVTNLIVRLPAAAELDRGPDGPDRRSGDDRRTPSATRVDKE